MGAGHEQRHARHLLEAEMARFGAASVARPWHGLRAVIRSLLPPVLVSNS